MWQQTQGTAATETTQLMGEKYHHLPQTLGPVLTVRLHWDARFAALAEIDAGHPRGQGVRSLRIWRACAAKDEAVMTVMDVAPRCVLTLLWQGCRHRNAAFGKLDVFLGQEFHF